MPLILKPSLDSIDHDAMRQHLEHVRARRMLAAVTYHAGVNAKLEHETDKNQRKVKQHMDMLAKEMLALEKASQKLEDRLASIFALEQEIGLLQDMRVEGVPTVED